MSLRDLQIIGFGFYLHFTLCLNRRRKTDRLYLNPCRCWPCAPGTRPFTILCIWTGSHQRTNGSTWLLKPRCSSATLPPWSWCSARGSPSTSTTNRLTTKGAGWQLRVVFDSWTWFSFYFIQSFTQSLKRRMSLKNTLYSCAVIYEIVSNIPKVHRDVLQSSLADRIVHASAFVFILPLFCPGLRGAGGEGNLGPHGGSRGQRGDSGWRDLHREVHPRSPGGGEHPESGEAATGRTAQTTQHFGL